MGVTISGIPFDFFGSERITGRCESFGIFPISLPEMARSNSKALTSVNNRALVLFTHKEKDYKNSTLTNFVQERILLTQQLKIDNQYKRVDPQ